MVEIRLFATFREGREKTYQMESDKLEKASDVLDILKIPYTDVAICLINGFHAKLQDSIKDGDIIAIFPPVGGG